MRKSRLLLKIVAILLVGVLIVEVVLRLFGFGNLPLYYSDTRYDYALKPNQKVHRFGCYFHVNESGMRSETVEPGSKRILKFGDSVLNGGLGTDQSELASSIVQEKLNETIPQAQVLNVSAGSWGPDNAFAWMQAYGDFQAEIIVLLFSSHDWQDQIQCTDVVGHVPFYPSEHPASAISDFTAWFWTRFVDPHVWSNLKPLAGCQPNTAPFNTGWDAFDAYCKQNDIPLLVYHHAERSEVSNQEWNVMGKQLEAYLEEKSIGVISGLKSGLTDADYRDKIHPTPSGQAKIANAIFPEVLKLISDDE